MRIGVGQIELECWLVCQVYYTDPLELYKEKHGRIIRKKSALSEMDLVLKQEVLSFFPWDYFFYRQCSLDMRENDTCSFSLAACVLLPAELLGGAGRRRKRHLEYYHFHLVQLLLWIFLVFIRKKESAERFSQTERSHKWIEEKETKDSDSAATPKPPVQEWSEHEYWKCGPGCQVPKEHWCSLIQRKSDKASEQQATSTK